MLALLFVAAAAMAFPSTTEPAGASQPTLTVTPGSSSGSYRSGQMVTVSVGPNDYFTPNAKVNILECADPGATRANLPTGVSTCDGNTIQGGTILVNRDGSFSQTAYPIFSLPNAVLGEQANWQPVCNATNACVLYVGQNQEDFTQPKLFSAPFTVIPSAGRGTSPTTSTTPTTSQSQSTVSSTSSGTPTTAPALVTATSTAPTDPPAVASDPTTSTVSAAALANTGPPALLAWIAGLAGLLILSGTAGRRLVERMIR
jgi:hypothetical protein